MLSAISAATNYPGLGQAQNNAGLHTKQQSVLHLLLDVSTVRFVMLADTHTHTHLSALFVGLPG